MKSTRLVVAGVALAALTYLGTGTAANAHHARAAEFDADAPVLLKGRAVVIERVNPDTWIHINGPDTDAEGKGKKGATVNRAIEGGTPNTLLRTGITRNSLRIDTEVVVRGHRPKDEQCDAHPKTKKKTCKAVDRYMTLPNSCELVVGSSEPGAPTDGSGVTDGGKQDQCASPA